MEARLLASLVDADQSVVDEKMESKLPNIISL